MSDEFQLASSGNWWDSPRTARFTTAPTSTSAAQITSGSFGWPPPPPDLSTDHDHFKARSIDSSSSVSGSSILTSDPSLHMMGLGLSSQPIDWHQNILNGGGKSENASNTSFRSMLQLEDHMNHHHHDQELIKQSNLGFSLDHHQQQQMMDPMAYGSPSTILHQQEMYHSSYGMNSNGLLPSWNPKYPTHLIRANQSVMQQQQQQQFSGNVSFWNTDSPTNFFPPSPPPSFTQSSTSIEQKTKNVVEIGETESIGKKSITEMSNKRQRSSEIVPSPPTFKVKKEKMGDRITALQQLVSPFGKTDTASVLSEAIEYIKFLHEQVSVLSNPYMKSGAPIMQHHKMVQHDTSKDLEESKQDLRSRGLCLVPVMSTFAVTHDTTVDFWNPTYGGTFR